MDLLTIKGVMLALNIKNILMSQWFESFGSMASEKNSVLSSFFVIRNSLNISKIFLLTLTCFKQSFISFYFCSFWLFKGKTQWVKTSWKSSPNFFWCYILSIYPLEFHISKPLAVRLSFKVEISVCPSLSRNKERKGINFSLKKEIKL